MELVVRREDCERRVAILSWVYLETPSNERTVSWVRSLFFDRFVGRSIGSTVCQLILKRLVPVHGSTVTRNSPLSCT